MVTTASSALSDKDLKRLYEDGLGKEVCDRTWRNVKRRLGLGKNNAMEVAEYARLRRTHPGKKLSRINVLLSFKRKEVTQQRKMVVDQYSAMTGEELKEFLNSKGISTPKIYRLGHSIGVPFSVKRIYGSYHLAIFAEAVGIEIIPFETAS